MKIDTIKPIIYICNFLNKLGAKKNTKGKMSVEEDYFIPIDNDAYKNKKVIKINIGGL